MSQQNVPEIDLHAGYQANATSADQQALIRFLDEVYGDPAMQAYKRHMRELLALRPGETVLEVGCGAGHDLVRDAQQVGPSGEVVGVDVKPAMLDEARRRTAGQPQVTCQHADARTLPRPDASVDACRVDRTLMYVADPEVVFGEMARVLRPGGRLVTMELDYGAILIDHPDERFTVRVLDALTASIPSPWLGRSQRRILTGAGLTEIALHTHGIELAPHLFRQVIAPTVRSAISSGQLPRQRTQQWLATLDEQSRSGRGYASFTAVVAHGRAPGEPVA